MNDATISISLHPKQLEVFQSLARFKVVVAGRRFGKSYLAIAHAVRAVLQNELNGYDLRGKGVFLVATTHDQAKRIYWNDLRRRLLPLIARESSNTGRIELVNDRFIEVRGADKPDSMRGVGLSDVVLDEYASMKPGVWEEILRPALADVGGGALFIGTPRGKNHFHELIQEHKDDPEWGIWRFKSVDNPFLDPAEIAKARRNMTSAQFRQEFEASFEGTGTGLLKQEWLRFGSEPLDGYYVVTVDLAGFVDETMDRSKYKRLDETAIAVVKVHRGGWHITDIRHGQWGVRETAIQILKAAHDYKVRRLGIEKGALLNAVMPYMSDRMRALNFYPEVVPLYHGGKKKVDRIMWALGGRFEHGRITLPHGAAWVPTFTEQYLDFPNELARDDLIDAVAYADQMADDVFEDYAALDQENSTFEPLDADAGY